MEKLEDAYMNTINEITLERKIKLKAKKIKHYFKPVYGVEKFKVKIGKVSIKDQVEAQKQDFTKLAPETTEQNVFFIAWLLNRLIKKADPYWDKSLNELVEMMCEETFTEVIDLWADSGVKKKEHSILMSNQN